MKTTADIIEYLKEYWSTPKNGIHKGEISFFELVCIFSKEKYSLTNNYPLCLPIDLIDFWNNTKEATLFYDSKYSQWGLKIFSPEDALLQSKEEIKLRSKDYLETDLVIGEFFGDSEKLIVDCSKENNGKVMVSMPIDSRKYWPVISDNFYDFLKKYVEVDGDKFWE